MITIQEYILKQKREKFILLRNPETTIFIHNIQQDYYYFIFYKYIQQDYHSTNINGVALGTAEHKF